MFKKSLLTVSILISMSVTLMGCEDDNGAANAQTCLDKIDDTVALATIQTQVDSCMAYVASDNSQKANVIKCSGYLLRAGLTSPKIVNAVKSLSDSSTHKEAAMIANLGLDDMDSVNTANSYCALTEIEGLIYFSSLTVMGTALKIATGNGS
ncbi:MAG: hypothetical protein KDD61_10870, partial [Bdellovibrionales bacterium]|nr:hypothetical protein [Bdellovibrionales bacterium]